MFSLAIYDTLTPGSLTDGETIAGTGTIDGDRQGRPDRRHPAEDRRPPATPAPSCSWCPPTTARTPSARPTATCGWSGPTTMHDALERGRRRGSRTATPTLPTLRAALSDPGHDRRRATTPTSTPTPALAAAVLEIESHIADGGWDQPARLYALVDTGAAGRARAGARRRDGPGRRRRRRGR